MATQWNGMGKQLLKVPVFKKTIERCHKVLLGKGLDLMHLLTSDNESIFENNVLNCMVAIGAVQIGMVNILREIGVVPDIMLGISFGEIGTAYADGCLTEEQAILTAYFRGYTVLEKNKVPGYTAIIGLGFEKVEPILPEDCDIAFHGDEDIIIKASNIPLHSRYLKSAAALLSECLKEVIPEPKISSESKIFTGQYYVNNLLNCVYLVETYKLLPKNWVLIGIAPTCLLRHTVTKSFAGSVYSPLSRKEEDDNIKLFKEALKLVSDNGHFVDWTKVNEVFDENNNY
uniref:Malonyl-CoA:ACP transacylase (MAT) domain-containing protein n=1 Tax=Megaselia scalaris TaxID=36166 RepID=T1GX34_MEGSC